MTPSLRQAMAWIHGWLGLLAGWILFAMFVTGTASYFRPEITRWMQPEIGANHTAPADAAASAVAYLRRVGGDDLQWFVYLPDDRTAATRVFEIANPKAAAPRRRAPELDLDPVTGEPIAARETRGGEQLYRFHFQLQLPHPWGRWLAGLCAMFMLAAIISGVITHRRMFADFFTLRWNKGRRSWLDAHNASAVLGLPYHALVTYTGLVTLVAMYMPWPIAANYAKPAEFAQAVYDLPADREATGRRVPLVPIAPLIRDAERRFAGPAGRLIVRNPGDAAATVAIYRAGSASINARAPSATYDGATGRLIARSDAGGAAATTAGVLLGLHIAQFADPALRWALFLLGTTGAAMVGTGLLLWTSARRKPAAKPFFGLRLVERLNIGVVAGLPVGIAAFFLANRLIPAAAEGRADREVAAMFWAWGAIALVQLVRPAKRAWTEALALGAIAFAAIPIVDVATTGEPIASIVAGDALFAAFDAAMLAIAALLGTGAWRASRPARPAPARTRIRETVHA